jgi:putative membrane protein
MHKILPYILLYLKGLAMGGADVVPGVSGGTIAFITGIYERLLNAIKSVDLDALKLLIRFEIKEFWNKIDGTFLIVLVLGIATSVLSLAKLITFLLLTYPIQVWSFFFGLIIISAILVAKSIYHWKPIDFLALLLGVLIAYFITAASPASTSDSLLFVFVSGAIAITAMILPGISGSFILLLLGKYQYMMQAISDINLPVILVFIAGCVVGILSTARAISWLLKRFYNPTIALLAGFMVGSLNKVWPWKKVVESIIDRHGEAKPVKEQNLLPNEYLDATGQDPFFLQALFFIFIGIAIVISIEKVANTLKVRDVK